jgi:tetratricopeptide (TPR) repeat protein
MSRLSRATRLHERRDFDSIVIGASMNTLPETQRTVIPKRAAWLALFFLLGSALANAQSLPPLPVLPLDTYEPAIREPIEAAWNDAAARPEDPARNGILGMALYAHEQYEFAVPCLERAQALDSGDGRWAYYLGRAELHLARYDRSAAALLEALRHRSDYLPAQVLLAQALLDAGRLDQSLSLYELLAANYPDLPEVQYGLGRIAATRGDTEVAAEHFRKACAVFPSFGAAHFALARVYRDLGQTERAREQLSLYQEDKLGWPIVSDPWLADITSLRNSATDHLRRGINLAADGRLQEAADEHEAALEVDPELIQTRINLIRLYGELGQPAKAEEHYRAALEMDPNLAEIHYNYGVLLAAQQKTAEAAEAFRKALERNPGYAEAHNNYAYFLMASGDLAEAAKHYQAALETKPDYSSAHFNLARILIQQGQIDDAIEHLRLALEPESEETPRYTYALAAAYARAGNHPEALRYMQQAREGATARDQSALLSAIERDLRRLEQETSP